MAISSSSSTESAGTSRPLSRRFRLWTALNLLTAAFYLAPLSLPGTRILLLLGLASFWTGVIAAFWPETLSRCMPLQPIIPGLKPMKIMRWREEL